MPPELSRRTLLASVGSLGTASLAGCDGLSRRSLESLPAPPSESLDDVEVHKVRTVESSWMFHTNSEGEQRRPSHEFLDSREELEGLEWNGALDAATDLRTFLSETDFTTRSAMAFQEPIDACRVYHLLQVRYTEGDLDTEFCRGLRPADVACSEGVEHTVGFGIRLPITDVEVTSIGWGIGRCDDAVGQYLDSDADSSRGESR